jgi:hypothetical protein
LSEAECEEACGQNTPCQCTTVNTTNTTFTKSNPSPSQNIQGNSRWYITGVNGRLDKELYTDEETCTNEILRNIGACNNDTPCTCVKVVTDAEIGNTKSTDELLQQFQTSQASFKAQFREAIQELTTELTNFSENVVTASVTASDNTSVAVTACNSNIDSSNCAGLLEQLAHIVPLEEEVLHDDLWVKEVVASRVAHSIPDNAKIKTILADWNNTNKTILQQIIQSIRLDHTLSQVLDAGATIQHKLQKVPRSNQSQITP